MALPAVSSVLDGSAAAGSFQLFLLLEVCQADYSFQMTAGLSECPPFILVARRRPGLPGAVRSARQRWRERESAAIWFKLPSCVTVRGWVFRREKGAVLSYGGLNREESSDATWVCPHIINRGYQHKML